MNAKWISANDLKCADIPTREQDSTPDDPDERYHGCTYHQRHKSIPIEIPDENTLRELYHEKNMSSREISHSSVRFFGFWMGKEKILKYLRIYGIPVKESRCSIYQKKRDSNFYG